MRLTTKRLAGAAVGAALLTLAACEQRLLPTIAQQQETPGGNPGNGGGTVPQPLLISPAQANMRLGDTLRLSVSGTGGAALNWSTSQPSVAVIHSVSGATAVVRAVGGGTASIAAAIASDTARRAAATISVTP